MIITSYFKNAIVAEDFDKMMKTFNGKVKRRESVITSYSIHYTKLYEVVLGYDLRKPKVNRYLGIKENDSGLSLYYSDKCSVENLINRNNFV